ncbi:MAG: hypothetical protein HZA13_09490 [Nitrospirae bacterium]|nr:hypothetical protein [Nitrospirota bacterium]
MFTKRTLYKASCLAILSMLAMVGIMCVPLGARPQWDRSSLYPAKVKAIKFADGLSIDRFNSISWGSWTVSFKDELPEADFKYFFEDQISSVSINLLKCSNKVEGVQSCTMFMGVKRKWGKEDCEILIIIGRDPDMRTKSLSIGCPSSLEFE